MKIFLNLLVVIYVLTGCSNKQYFEPEDTVDANFQRFQTPANIASFNKDGATLEDYRVLNQDGISTYFLDNGYHFLNKVDSTVISSDKQGNIMLNKTVINLGENIVSASLKDNLLAVVFDNNSIVLYDTIEKKIKLKKKFKSSLLNDTRIANPIFLKSFVIFPTLDGKIKLVDLVSYKIIKTINIDPKGKINNVIFLKTIDNVMVVATSNKILTISDDSFSLKDYEIKDIIVAGKFIYVATIDGNIMKLNLQLEKISSRKFKFAKIYALGFGTSLYALESQGYLIKLDSSLETSKVYDFSFDEDSKVIAIGDTLYFDDEFIKLQ